jgi:branched-subunit amino acid transport protein AzlD
MPHLCYPTLEAIAPQLVRQIVRAMKTDVMSILLDYAMKLLQSDTRKQVISAFYLSATGHVMLTGPA